MNLDTHAGEPRQHVCIDCSAEFRGRHNRRRCDSCKAARQPQGRRHKNCVVCAVDIQHMHYCCKLCEQCRKERRKYYSRRIQFVQNDNQRSRMLTKYAVKIGFLPDPRDFQCVDCRRRQAECYDHRDYSKPLDVDPVCLSCNSSRGKGKVVYFPVKDCVNA